jgi:hypothetical protein
MLTVLIFVGVILVGFFGFVVFFGAPYLPTLKSQKEEALNLLDLRPGQVLVELGSGDGRMLRAAAERGIVSIGYELNPVLVVYSKIVNFKYRSLITIKLKNFWTDELPECNGIYVFLLDKFMDKLDKKITQEKHSSIKLVSFAFELPNKKHIKESSGLYLYKFTSKTK